MQTRIKICGITRADDMLVAVDAGADAIGLVFAPQSKRANSIEQATAILNQCPPFLTKVGLFVDPDVDTIREHLAELPLDLLQFHGDESDAFCAQFAKPFIKAIRVQSAEQLSDAATQYPHASGLLLDAFDPEMHGGTGKTFDWSMIGEIVQPLILAGGLAPENVQSAVERVRPFAVDVSSGVEASPGVKNHAKIRAFCEKVRAADDEA